MQPAPPAQKPAPRQPVQIKHGQLDGLTGVFTHQQNGEWLVELLPGVYLTVDPNRCKLLKK